jgi:hypothetical protein
MSVDMADRDLVAGVSITQTLSRPLQQIGIDSVPDS